MQRMIIATKIQTDEVSVSLGLQNVTFFVVAVILQIQISTKL